LLLSYPNVAVDELEACLAYHFDESRLRWLIERHRVWNLVMNNINKLPRRAFSDEFYTWLESENRRCKQQTLLQFKTQTELAKMFSQAGIKCRFFKGIDLSLRLYGNLGSRFSRDIDVLVPVEDALSAEQILLNYGYSVPDSAYRDTDTGGIMITSFYKDKGYKAVGLPTFELHTRVNNEDTPFSRSVTSHFMAGEPALSVIEYIYLCFHAMKSNCHRIKWLVDLAVYYQKLDELIPNWHAQKWLLARKFGIDKSVIVCEKLMAEHLGVRTESRDFIGLTPYSTWVAKMWLCEMTDKVSLVKILSPMFLNKNMYHQQLAVESLLFCPNAADRAFINRYAKGDGKYLQLLLPFRKFARYARRKLSIN
jgi:hypothetical protein